MAQWNGIGVVSYYLTLVLDTVGVTDSFDQTLINGLLQIFKCDGTPLIFDQSSR